MAIGEGWKAGKGIGGSVGGKQGKREKNGKKECGGGRDGHGRIGLVLKVVEWRERDTGRVWVENGVLFLEREGKKKCKE